MAHRITEADIEGAQRIWAGGIVEIGRAFLEQRDYRALARSMVDGLYGYQEGAVLFKPTKAREEPFRFSATGAVSYFVGGEREYPEDHGFALKPWTRVRFENAAFLFRRDHALAMGHYYFTDEDGEEMKVEFTFGYFRAEGSRLKIDLHHSSLPFS
jgi:hypothetical protein